MHDQPISASGRAELLALAARRLRDIHKAEDAVQEALLRAHRAGSIFSRHPNPRAYLRLALRHAIASLWRADRRFCQPEEGLEALADRRDCGQQALIVRDAIEELAGQQRRAMELHLEGHEHGEVAEEMGLNIKAVYRLVHQARRRLRQLLDQPPTKQKSGRRPPANRAESRSRS